MLSWLPPFPGPSKSSAHLFLAPQPGFGPRSPPFSLAVCCCTPSCWDLYRVLLALALTRVELKALPLTPSQCSVLVARPPCSVVSFWLSPLSWASHCRVVSTEASREAQPIPSDRRRQLPESQGGPEPSSPDAQPVPAQALAGTPPVPKALPSQSTRPSAASEPKLAPNPADWV